MTFQEITRRHRCAGCSGRIVQQAAPVEQPEQVGFWEVVRLTAFVLFMLAALVYALPVLLEAML